MVIVKFKDKEREVIHEANGINMTQNGDLMIFMPLGNQGQSKILKVYSSASWLSAELEDNQINIPT